ncbi:MAG: GFA family protein [Alphaproteobacteria bacterium]|nr:GFA family protein [Alphaproteobacteria bacterium]
MSLDVGLVHLLHCHCGAVEIELTLPKGIEDPRRCSCSMCSRRGAVVASVLLDDLKILKGEDNLGLYQFNTMTAKHFFCKTCGIYTHHQRRSNPTQYGYNVACLDGINVFELENVRVADGIAHPSDV